MSVATAALVGRQVLREGKGKLGNIHIRYHIFPQSLSPVAKEGKALAQKATFGDRKRKEDRKINFWLSSILLVGFPPASPGEESHI